MWRQTLVLLILTYIGTVNLNIYLHFALVNGKYYVSVKMVDSEILTCTLLVDTATSIEIGGVILVLWVQTIPQIKRLIDR
jgi:hypothetical protein